MIGLINQNAGAVTAITTVALLFVTIFYTWTTHQLLSEAKITRFISNEPRIVAYLRVNEVLRTVVQLHIANLSPAAAADVSAFIEKITEWPEDFDLQDSKILRDLLFRRPYETLKFDLGVGYQLFRNEQAAEFRAKISYSSLDRRQFVFETVLRVESVEGRSLFQIHGIDDIARSLKEISDTLKGFTGFRRVQVDSYNTEDRTTEIEALDKRREEIKKHI